MREQNAFHMMYDPPISKLESMAYPKLSITAFNHLKQKVMSVSNYTETQYRDVRMFMQLMQCCVFIRPSMTYEH